MPSKKTNTFLFMLIGTVVNIVLLLFFIVFGFVLLSVLAARVPSIADSLGILSILVLVLALVLSFLIYSRLLKWATKKYALEENLSPLFSSRKNRKRTEE